MGGDVYTGGKQVGGPDWSTTKMNKPKGDCQMADEAKVPAMRAGETAQQLSALVALPGDQSSSLSTHIMVAHNGL